MQRTNDEKYLREFAATQNIRAILIYVGGRQAKMKLILEFFESAIILETLLVWLNPDE